MHYKPLEAERTLLLRIEHRPWFSLAKTDFVVLYYIYLKYLIES
jgi:hypothetical protein